MSTNHEEVEKLWQELKWQLNTDGPGNDVGETVRETVRPIMQDILEREYESHQLAEELLSMPELMKKVLDKMSEGFEPIVLDDEFMKKKGN